MSNLQFGDHESAASSSAARGDGSLRHVVITIPADPEVRGWPPVATERLWATPLEGNRFRIENIPFFAKGLSFGDIVTGPSDKVAADGSITFREVAERGGHSTYRVMVTGELGSDRHNAYHLLLSKLRDLGATTEIANARLFAIDVSPSVVCGAIYDVLALGAEEGIWDFEVGDYQSQS